jgi:hypothetical protein
VIRESPTEPAAALAPNLRAQLLERHRAQALDLVAEAMGSWRAEGFLRYDNRENSCTVRVFSWMLRIIEPRLDTDPVQILPVIEGVTPNEEQLAGRANFANAKRPDIVLYLGGNHAVRMCVECKRFHGSANAQQYTEKGILRFLTREYITDAGRGVMIGYVMTRSMIERVSQVNEQILKHPLMGAEHRLAVAPIDDVHVSTHTGSGITLTHLFLDMCDVVSKRQGLLKTRATTVRTSTTR